MATNLTAAEQGLQTLTSYILGGTGNSISIAQSIADSSDTSSAFTTAINYALTSLGLGGFVSSTAQTLASFAKTSANSRVESYAQTASSMIAYATFMAQTTQLGYKIYQTPNKVTVADVEGWLASATGIPASSKNGTIALYSTIIMAGLTVASTLPSAKTTTISSLYDTVKAGFANYLSQLSAADQAAFSTSLNSGSQAALAGAMLVPQVDANGTLTGFTQMTPIDSIVNGNGSTVYYFSGGNAVVVPASSDSSSPNVWTLNADGTQSPTVINIYPNGSCTYQTQDASGNQIALSTSSKGSFLKVTPTEGVPTLDLLGDPSNFNISNANIEISENASAVITGTGNTISVRSGASLTVNSGSGSNAINEASHYTNQNPANDWHWLSDMLINTVAA